jgi:ABC-type transport system involved in multi-copper enzyme maturation permease subunit
MFSILVVKELRAILRSPKFAAAFGVCSLLLLLSVVVGIQEYRATAAQYALGMELNRQTLRSQASWMGLSSNAYRAPDPMQVLATGIANNIGRFSAISATSPVKLRHSVYTDEPLYALFGPVDPAFVVAVVFSLMAILFSYDAINGERESGTLQLAFANPIPRRVFVAAKFAGSWLGLAIPLSIPVLIATALIQMSGVPLLPAAWVRYAAFWGFSYLLLTFFLAFGLFTSAIVRRSSSSFLIALAGWVVLVFLIPRLAVLAAGDLRPAPSAAEVDAERDLFAKDQWDEHLRTLASRWQERSKGSEGMREDEALRSRKEKMPEWRAEDDADRIRIQRVIDEQATRLQEQRENALRAQQALAVSLARVSPVSAYTFAVTALAGTGPDLLEETQDSMRRYREVLTTYVAQRQKETGSTGGFRINFDSETGFSFSLPRDRGTLDLAGLPAYELMSSAPVDRSPSEIIDSGIIALAALLAFTAALAAFHRFDLR